MTLYFSRSKFSMTARADITETSCSPERPPNTTATLSFLLMLKKVLPSLETPFNQTNFPVDRALESGYPTAVRSQVAIVILLAVMMFFSGHAASAQEWVPSQPGAATVSQDFCGQTPPASIACPETGLNHCQCYLAPDDDMAGPAAVEMPRRRAIAPKPKRRVLALLPEFSYTLTLLSAHQHSLDRPPR